MELYRRRTEAMMYDLQSWITNNLDNEYQGRRCNEKHA